MSTEFIPLSLALERGLEKKEAKESKEALEVIESRGFIDGIDSKESKASKDSKESRDRSDIRYTGIESKDRSEIRYTEIESKESRDRSDIRYTEIESKDRSEIRYSKSESSTIKKIECLSEYATAEEIKEYLILVLKLHVAKEAHDSIVFRHILLKNINDLRDFLTKLSPEDIKKLTECKTAGGDSPLMLAAYLGFEEIVKLLLETGFKINQKNTEGLNALHAASLSGYLPILNQLIIAQVPLFEKTKKGNNFHQILDPSCQKKFQQDYFYVSSFFMDDNPACMQRIETSDRHRSVIENALSHFCAIMNISKNNPASFLLTLYNPGCERYYTYLSESLDNYKDFERDAFTHSFIFFPMAKEVIALVLNKCRRIQKIGLQDKIEDSKERYEFLKLLYNYSGIIYMDFASRFPINIQDLILIVKMPNLKTLSLKGEQWVDELNSNIIPLQEAFATSPVEVFSAKITHLNNIRKLFEILKLSKMTTLSLKLHMGPNEYNEGEFSNNIIGLLMISAHKFVESTLSTLDIQLLNNKNELIEIGKDNTFNDYFSTTNLKQVRISNYTYVSPNVSSGGDILAPESDKTSQVLLSILHQFSSSALKADDEGEKVIQADRSENSGKSSKLDKGDSKSKVEK